MNCCDDYGNCNQGRDCPAKKGFDMNRLSLISICFITAIITAFTVAWFMATHQYLEQYDHGFESGFALGFTKGGDEAVRVNPVSARLEAACTSIWISEQVLEQKKRGIK
jgi:hypothetical protein